LVDESGLESSSAVPSTTDDPHRQHLARLDALLVNESIPQMIP
jgi:hypothetical protein